MDWEIDFLLLSVFVRSSFSIKKYVLFFVCIFIFPYSIKEVCHILDESFSKNIMYILYIRGSLLSANMDL